MASSGSEDPEPSKDTPRGAVPAAGVGVRTARGGAAVTEMGAVALAVRLVVSVTVKRAVKVPGPYVWVAIVVVGAPEPTASADESP
jgi:hypothetical protein